MIHRFKKIRKTNYKRSLTRELIVYPTVVIVATSILMFIILNFFIDKYIKERTIDAFDKAYIPYNQYFEDNENRTFMHTNKEGILTANSILLDEKLKQISTIHNFNASNIDEVDKEILNTIKRDPGLYGTSIQKVFVNNNTYTAEIRIMHGKLENGFIKQTSKDEEKLYFILVYTNITPMQRFLNYLNKSLICLIFISVILTIISLLGAAKKVEKSFIILRKRLYKIAKRENMDEEEIFTFKEFSNINKTIEDISYIIKNNEDNQKKFFQNASHELRTPLMSIHGYAEGIQNHVFKDNKKATEIIMSETAKMTELINQILYLARVDSHAASLNYTLTDVKSFIYDSLDKYIILAKNSNINIDLKIEDNLGKIEMVPMQMERAFSNLISNALKYTKDEIKVQVYKDDSNIFITVEDNGEGIKEDEAIFIFDRFFKGEKGNFGIGLAITKEVVLQHKGEIYLGSAKPAKFIMKLPQK